MRRLLIRLVAVETMLVGWLSYWIFLIYVNNPAVGAGLSNQLSKFPQLSFTTIDLAVLVVIAALSIALAFKFYRGLRPGIRLERALQMLENLMKRNLVLEAQVAELRVEKAEKISSRSLPSTSGGLGPRGSSFAVAAESSPTEPRQGSWEKAFRTPLEAGPPTAKVSSSSFSDVPFQRETGIPPSRTEEAVPNPGSAKQVMTQAKIGSANMSEHVEEKAAQKSTQSPSSASGSAGWEESPKYVGEARGILEPSNAVKKSSSTVDSTLQNQPYIPVPAPRTTPSSVIVGPMNQKPSPARLTPRPIVRPAFSNKSFSKEFSSPSSADVKPPSLPIVTGKKESQTDSKPLEQTKPSAPTGEEETREKPPSKPPFVFKKKFPDPEHS